MSSSGNLGRLDARFCDERWHCTSYLNFAAEEVLVQLGDLANVHAAMVCAALQFAGMYNITD